MLQWLANPLLWLAVFFADIFLCAAQMDKAAKRLGIKPPQRGGSSPKTISLVKNVAASVVVALVAYYLLFHTTLVVALLAVGAFCLGIWFQAYKYRVRPLVTSGLSLARARVITVMQLLWVGPISIAIALFVWESYRGP